MDKVLVWLDIYKYSLAVTFLCLCVLWYAFLKMKKSAIAHVKDSYGDWLIKADLYLAADTRPYISFSGVTDVSVYDDEVCVSAVNGVMTILGPTDYLVATGKPSQCVKEKSRIVEVYADGVLMFTETVFDFTTSENFGFVGYLPDGRDICVCLGRNLTLIATK